MAIDRFTRRRVVLGRESVQGAEEFVSDLERRIAELEGREAECRDALPKWVQGPGILGAILDMKERIAELEAQLTESSAKAVLYDGILATDERDARLAELEAENKRLRTDLDYATRSYEETCEAHPGVVITCANCVREEQRQRIAELEDECGSWVRKENETRQLNRTLQAELRESRKTCVRLYSQLQQAEKENKRLRKEQSHTAEELKATDLDVQRLCSDLSTADMVVEAARECLRDATPDSFPDQYIRSCRMPLWQGLQSALTTYDNRKAEGESDG